MLLKMFLTGLILLYLILNCWIRGEKFTSRTRFILLMENLEIHGILQFHFPSLESHGF